jgi:glycosyltransferase involved in cell wall biosynthesis
MKVLMLSKACLVGAYQRKLEELAKFADIDLTVAVPPFWHDERGVMPLERAHTDGYQLVVEPIALNGHFHTHFYPRLGRQVSRLRPDIFHIDEEPYNLATFLALRLARRFGAKSLFFTWQNLYRRYPPPFSWLEAYVLRRADYAIAGNTGAIDVLRRKGYAGPVKVIPQFGVDPQLYNPSPFVTQHSTFTVAYVGRLVAEKGIDVLLRAAAGLEDDWQLRILGSGPERARLEVLARELGIASRTSFDRPIPSTQMPRYYERLDALVLPSLTRPNWKEQFGRVLIEAMVCGVPVVGSACGEIPNVIGDAGLVFPEGDVDALRANLARLHSEPGLRAELARRGRERVLANYTQAQIAAQTYELYRELASRR